MTESNAFQQERLQEFFAASDGRLFCEVQSKLSDAENPYL
jgi:hypothetical protein